MAKILSPKSELPLSFDFVVRHRFDGFAVEGNGDDNLVTQTFDA